jgi:hypothetical protein
MIIAGMIGTVPANIAIIKIIARLLVMGIAVSGASVAPATAVEKNSFHRRVFGTSVSGA